MIGAKAKYSYAKGNQPIAVTYFDDRGKLIPVEVNVEEVAANSTASKIGLQANDRLIAYTLGKRYKALSSSLTSLAGRAVACENSPTDAAKMSSHQTSLRVVSALS